MRYEANLTVETILSATCGSTLSRPSKAPPVIESFRISLISHECLVVTLEFKDHHSAEKVAAAEYRLALKLLGLTQLAAAQLLGVTLRSSQRYACAKHAVPEKVMDELWSWVATIARLPEDDQRLGYAALRIITRKSRQERRYFAAQDPVEALRVFHSEALQRLRAKSGEH